jgi:hypothetical protein
VTPDLPPPVDQLATGTALAVIGGLAGRLMWHAREVQRGRRAFLSRHLLWEFPVAFGCGLIGAGAAEWLGLAGMAQVGLITAGSYLGPGFVEAVVWRVVDRLAPRSPSQE